MRCLVKISLFLQIILFLMIASGAQADSSEALKGFERAYHHLKQDACALAKKSARESYEILHMNPGCQCFITDGHQWMCDARFTYTEQRGSDAEH
jgi:hypothetical protein